VAGPAEELLVRENQRLRREVKALRARLVAMEASRWWRLHPRVLWRRHQPASPRPPDPASRVQVKRELRLEPGDSLAARFRAEILAQGTFTRDWFSGGIPVWEQILHPLEGRRAEMLEIGSFEGLSACYLLWRLPDARITCIDTFAGGIEHRLASNNELSGLETTFDHNVALVDASRVRKLVGESRRRLLDLVAEEGRFDLVYIDGSHLGLDVIVDASLSWQLLNPAGVVVFDDYGWSELGDDPLLRPGPAIDAFLGLVDGNYEPLFQGTQVAVRKTR